MRLEFSRQIFEKKKKAQISSFIKIRQWEPSCSMRTDKRTDMTKLIVAFRNFEKEPKKLKKNREAIQGKYTAIADIPIYRDSGFTPFSSRYFS
jgi:hypothetical protein